MNEVTPALLPVLIPDTFLKHHHGHYLSIQSLHVAAVQQVGDKVYPLLPLRDKAQGRERLPSRTQPCSSPAAGCLPWGLQEIRPAHLTLPTVEQKEALGS